MRTALLFPGQGAPAAGWREATERTRPDLLERSRELLGEDPFARFGDGTEWDQPAIYCASLAAFELASRPSAAVHAGHSLGELAALACAGAIAGADGLEVVVERGRLMARVAAATDGAMLAVGAPAGELGELRDSLDLAVANLNTPFQTVLSGPGERIEQAETRLRARRIRAKRLAVAGAFHSPQMEPAADGFRAVLERFRFAEPRVPVLSGRTGRPFADVAAELAAAIVEPVRWIDVLTALEDDGIEHYVEVGPGRALTNMAKRSASGPVSVETVRPEEAAHA